MSTFLSDIMKRNVEFVLILLYSIYDLLIDGRKNGENKYQSASL